MKQDYKYFLESDLNDYLLMWYFLDKQILKITYTSRSSFALWS